MRAMGANARNTVTLMNKTVHMGKSYLLAAMLFAVGNAVGDVHTWVGGSHNGGGWNNPTNWENESGVHECPVEGDTALFNKYNETVVANETDATLVCSLAAVYLNGWSYVLNQGQTVVFDFDNDHHAACAVYGIGKFIKRGSGTLYLDNVDSTIASGSYGIKQNFIPLPGGLIIEDGTVWFPQNSSLVFGCANAGIDIARGATIHLSNGANTMINWLRGEGTVTVDSSTTRTLQVGMASTDAPKCTFGGKFTGNLRVDVYGGLALTGTESDNSAFYVLRRGPGDHMNNGYVAMTSFGNPGDPSSIGTSTLYLLYTASFRYIGTGEVSSKNIYYDVRALTGTPDAVIFDGGPTGGLKLTGDISMYNSSSYMTTIILCGSNAAPCTIAGKFYASYTPGNVPYTPYILKRDPGVWRFADNATRTHAGVYEVEEGTLQFDSIAEVGHVCALGFATNLSERYTGAYNASKRVSYAYRLGSAGVTNAVFEYTGASAGTCSTRPAVLAGDAHIRASGAPGAPLDFSGVSALSAGSYVLTVDGTNTDANVLREVSDGAGVVSLVKDGPGNWTLDGNQRFTGPLSVKAGTLTVAGPKLFTWFRVTFNGGYGSPYGTYIPEVGLYDVNGVRRNSNLTFNLPAGKNWTNTWYPNNVAPNLGEGEMSYDGDGSNTYYLYDENGSYGLVKLTDGTGSAAQFSRGTSETSVQIVSMRLADDTPEIAYFDFSQSDANYQSAGYQTPSAFVLEGSADGSTWTTLLSTNNLSILSGGKWRFSASGQKVADYAGSRDVANGEGLAFSTRAVATDGASRLESLGTVSVAAGATLRTTGCTSPVITSLEVDGVSGAGSIEGFTFAQNVTVNIVGRPRGTPGGMLPADFSGCEGFDTAQWTFLENGAASLRRSYQMTENGIQVTNAGAVIILH